MKGASAAMQALKDPFKGPRWTTYDAKFLKKALPTDVPATIQDRAYATPIWYTPD